MSDSESQQLSESVSTHLTREQRNKLEGVALARSEPGNRVSVAQLLREWINEQLDQAESLETDD